jgi:hypothetical protein
LFEEQHMALKPHERIMEMADAFDMADRNVKPDPLTGRSNYTMGAKGLPRTPAQQASVKKAAAKSALMRKTKADAAVAVRVPKPAVPEAHKPGISTGGLSLASRPKTGLLG